MATREELIRKLDLMIEDERKAQDEYRELICEVYGHFKLDFGGCPTEEVNKAIMDIITIPQDEMMHMLILEKIRCLLS